MVPELTQFARKALDQYEKRRLFVETKAWAIPSEEALEAIKVFVGEDTILEIGAGLGYWAKLLSDKGVKVIATDNMCPSWTHNTNIVEPYCDVLKMSHHKAIHAFRASNALFLCWPPYNSPMADQSLKKFKGNKLIYIGERSGGCNATDDFFWRISKDWEHNTTVSIQRWHGIYDVLELYTRKVTK